MSSISASRPQLRRLSRLALCAAGLTCLVTGVPAAKDRPAAQVQQLLSQKLDDIPGKEVILLTVSYLPGGTSLPHRHDADVFVYVLEGSLRMQVDGQPAVIVHAGQTFHEGPADLHRVSENASRTRSARFLVFMVKDVGRPASRAAGSLPPSP
jgi:quercetin dioxygenase-like cupin family protein